MKMRNWKVWGVLGLSLAVLALVAYIVVAQVTAYYPKG
jgi:hypothetical protein